MTPYELYAQVLAVIDSRVEGYTVDTPRAMHWKGLRRIAELHQPYSVTGEWDHCGECMTLRGPQPFAVFLPAPCPTLRVLAGAVGVDVGGES